MGGRAHPDQLGSELVFPAWHHARPLPRTPGKTLTQRRAGLPPAVRARGTAADRRLRRRWLALKARTKPAPVIAVAVARELAGWCWSLATMTD
jgi:transposase